MSEVEIRRRQAYKRNRKNWIIIQAVALVVVAVIALGSFLIHDRMNRTYYIEYTENGTVDYMVQYADNGFFEEEWIGSGQSYVSSLIQNIEANFKYALNMDTADIDFDYSYGVVAQLIVSDKDTGDHLFDPTDVIIPESTVKAHNSDSIKIDKSVYIDFDKYDSLAHSFIDSYGLKNATSMLVVTMNVNVLSQSDEFENNNENKYSVSLNIPLGEENFSIFSSASAPSGESKVLASKGEVSRNLFSTIGFAAAIIAFILACILTVFVDVTKNHDVNYAIKVKKLLSSYRSFIQQISGEFDTEGYQTVQIKSFNEMLGIRDTIQSPILMSENRDETMTQFLIPTNTNILYVYEIKVENYDEIYAAYAEVEEAETVEEVKEEVKEEVHGIVLEFTDEQGVEEAVIIEENVDMEQLTEAMSTPDVVLDNVDFVEDNDEDFEGTEETPGVEVVGVVWPERRKKNKVYRYDPNGEQLAEGDMVLVPTRDVARDREVIRKAAIAHGNHKIDPALHPHPLKKIIGVIKRRAEAALTPDIPDEPQGTEAKKAPKAEKSSKVIETSKVAEVVEPKEISETVEAKEAVEAKEIAETEEVTEAKETAETEEVTEAKETTEAEETTEAKEILEDAEIVETSEFSEKGEAQEDNSEEKE